MLFFIPMATHTRRPLMFRDENAEEVLSRAKRISDLKNLGPASELAFKAAGILSVDQFVRLGWQGALQKLVKANPKNRHTIFAYALIGALNNQDWNRLSEQQKLEAKEFTASLKPLKNKSASKKSFNKKQKPV